MIVSRALYVRRRITNGVFITLSIAAALFGLIWRSSYLPCFRKASPRFRPCCLRTRPHRRASRAAF